MFTFLGISSQCRDGVIDAAYQGQRTNGCVGRAAPAMKARQVSVFPTRGQSGGSPTDVPGKTECLTGTGAEDGSNSEVSRVVAVGAIVGAMTGV